jgi:hypothetical protein
MKTAPLRALSALSALALTLVPVVAQDMGTTHAAKPSFLDFNSISLTFLGNPPADGSPQTKAEIATMLQIQSTRTPDDVARAESEVHLQASAFAGVLGSWFTPENVPITTAFLQEVRDNAGQIAGDGKKLWNRPRPPLQDARLHPCVELPKSAAYPSGHSTMGMTLALVLAEIVPDRQTDILARGRQIGDDRVLAGVHFPSDVEAGRVLAAELMKRFDANPAFQAELAKAKAEVAAARTKVPVVTK